MSFEKMKNKKTPPPLPTKTTILGQAYNSFGYNGDSGFSGFVI